MLKHVVFIPLLFWEMKIYLMLFEGSENVYESKFL